ncbi:MAG: hypothetical protein ACOWWM_21155 [Desulfobacterales bacterium]
MEDSTAKRSQRRSLPVLVAVGLVIVVLLAVIRFWPDRTPSPSAVNQDPEKTASSSQNTEGAGGRPVISYDQLGEDEELRALMEERKGQYNLDESVDMLARSDETVDIHGNSVSMKAIQELIRQKTGEIAEEAIGPDGRPLAVPTEMFGIHVVQPGDNLWNIHFSFLRDYFGKDNIKVSPLADEPTAGGYSSGIGKLLKFSENLVYIYNIKDKRLDADLDMIEPFSKIVVYKMDTIFELLGHIDYQRIDDIRFDGDTLWIPPAS